MATNIDEKSVILPVNGNGRHNRRRSGSYRRKMLFLGKSFLQLGCLVYSVYLTLLLAYLKDNPYYWLLCLVPFIFSLLLPLFDILMPKIGLKLLRNKPSSGVIITLMTCFTMLTRLAYYHRQPDEFIGPRFIIVSLEGSLILILLDSCLQGEGKLKNVLKNKDVLTRMLLDFVDIFNMAEVLSASECIGVGSSVSENSSTETAIQAFCTTSFLIVWIALNMVPLVPEELEDQSQSSNDGSERQIGSRKHGKLFLGLTITSTLIQNLPFLVIRIVVWAWYNLYSLGFLVKNATVVVIFIVLCVKDWKDKK